MKPAPFTYHDPRTIEDAVSLIAEHEDARLLAGGQSLVPMLNFRFVQPAHLIDLNGVEALNFISRAGDDVTIGAMTRQRTLERSSGIADVAPIIPLALSHVGHRQTRARGTLGGSLCHFDPSAELCNLAALFDAELVLARKGGERRVRFSQFGLGYLSTAAAPDELLKEVRLKHWPHGHGFAFEEFSMRHGDFAICAVSCLVTLRASGEIDDIAIAVSGVSPTPVRLREVEVAMRGQRPSRDLFRAAAEKASALEATSDAYVTAAYRKHLARILTFRAIEKATGAKMEIAA
jgi:carbon-monoxide dehydrogenase medium subunit